MNSLEQGFGGKTDFRVKPEQPTSDSLSLEKIDAADLRVEMNNAIKFEGRNNSGGKRPPTTRFHHGE